MNDLQSSVWIGERHIICRRCNRSTRHILVSNAHQLAPWVLMLGCSRRSADGNVEWRVVALARDACGWEFWPALKRVRHALETHRLFNLQCYQYTVGKEEGSAVIDAVRDHFYERTHRGIVSTPLEGDDGKPSHGNGSKGCFRFRRGSFRAGQPHGLCTTCFSCLQVVARAPRCAAECPGTDRCTLHKYYYTSSSSSFQTIFFVNVESSPTSFKIRTADAEGTRVIAEYS